jgi:hypothetical protein
LSQPEPLQLARLELLPALAPVVASHYWQPPNSEWYRLV